MRRAYEKTGKKVVVLIDEFYTQFFIEDLENGNVDSFLNRMRAFFVGVPNDLNNKTEKDYQTIFFVLVKLMGQFVRAEEKSAIGRSDIVIETDDSVYCFEFKMDENATAEDALKQINSTDYAIPYITNSRKIVKIGVEFSRTERGVKRWLIEQ